MRRYFFPIAITMIILAVAACSGGSGGSSNLVDRMWNLTELSGKPPASGSSISAEFTADGRVSGSAGCNQYSGSYKVSGKKITFSSAIATTLTACNVVLNVQETAYLKALSDARTYSVSGEQLTLLDANKNTLAVFHTQVQALAGTTWDALRYNNGKQAVVSVLSGTSLTAGFETDGVITGSSGCNTFSGSYKLDGNHITIGALTVSKVVCSEPAGIMDQEAQYIAALQTADTFIISGNRMELHNSQDAVVVVFNAQ